MKFGSVNTTTTTTKIPGFEYFEKVAAICIRPLDHDSPVLCCPTGMAYFHCHNSMKLSHACGATQDGGVMVERSDRMWSTGERNGKPLQYSCLENPKNSMKGKKIGH